MCVCVPRCIYACRCMCSRVQMHVETRGQLSGSSAETPVHFLSNRLFNWTWRSPTRLGCWPGQGLYLYRAGIINVCHHGPGFLCLSWRWHSGPYDWLWGACDWLFYRLKTKQAKLLRLQSPLFITHLLSDSLEYQSPRTAFILEAREAKLERGPEVMYSLFFDGFCEDGEGQDLKSFINDRIRKVPGEPHCTRKRGPGFIC